MTPMKKAAIRVLIVATILFGLIHSVQAVTYVYDDLNRLTEVRFEDGTWVTYGYDEIGNRLQRAYYGLLTITATSGTGGSVSPSSAQVVYGGSQAFTITPATGYHITSVLVDGASVGAAATYTFSNVTTGHTLLAAFALNTYNITTSVVAGSGTISPAAPVVTHGGSQTFTITPATGYHVADVLVDGSSVGAVTSHTLSNVTTNRTLQASFALNTYTINATVTGNTGGTISPTSATVTYGGSRTFTMTPNTGYHVADVLVDGSSAGAPTSYTFSNVAANHTIQVTFAVNTYTITGAVADGYGGTVSPASATVTHGGSQTFTIATDSGFSLANVAVDGILQGPITSCTFTNVTAPHRVTAIFDYLTDPVKNARTGATFAGLQAAYEVAADGDRILCRNFRLTEDFLADRSISVSIEGGYNADFTSNPNKTILIGAPEIRTGTVTWTNSKVTDKIQY